MGKSIGTGLNDELPEITRMVIVNVTNQGNQRGFKDSKHSHKRRLKLLFCGLRVVMGHSAVFLGAP